MEITFWLKYDFILLFNYVISNTDIQIQSSIMVCLDEEFVNYKRIYKWWDLHSHHLKSHRLWILLFRCKRICKNPLLTICWLKCINNPLKKCIKINHIRKLVRCMNCIWLWNKMRLFDIFFVSPFYCFQKYFVISLKINIAKQKLPTITSHFLLKPDLYLSCCNYGWPLLTSIVKECRDFVHF